MEKTETTEIQKLFLKAKAHGGFEYLYVLVRIDGIQCYGGYRDELVFLRDWLKQPDASDRLKAYRFLVSKTEGLELLQNLLNCANRKHYQIPAFLHLVKGQFPNAVWPTTRQKIDSLAADAKASGFPALAHEIAASYPPDVVDTDQPNADALSAAFNRLSDFLRQLLDCYFSERLKFKRGDKYIKLPESLDVLELITDEEFGLSGLRVHFAQNCTAELLRTPKGVFGTNLEFGPPVTFLMMSVNPTSNEYRVDGKRLYEIGLPGRYNQLGEWKPLIYPGNPDHLIKECEQLSKDPDVRGVLMYLRLTGHRCIEFALRTNLELPGEYTTTKKGGLHFWKCPSKDYETEKNISVYDCWLDLNTAQVEEIEWGLSAISYLISVICFPFGAAYSWRNKYRMTIGGIAHLTPAETELKIVDDILQKFESTENHTVLAAAMDWYNRGSISTNVFTSFFCFYVALESVAVAIADGANLGKTQIPKKTRAEKKASIISCIQEKHAAMFATEPIKFVEASYFQCVQSLASKTKAAVSAVFGDQHPYFKLLFEESSDGDIALSKLRSELAHGGVYLLDRQHEHLVRKHLHEIGRIAKEFLLRVLFRLEASEPVPEWSGAFQKTISTADPRSTMVSTTHAVFPKGTDWRIRAEWCE